MSLADDVLTVIIQKPGLTEIEVARTLFGPNAVQQRVNPICRRLIAERQIERRRSGYGSAPYTYHPTALGREATPADHIKSSTLPLATKPELNAAYLIEHGFQRCAQWTLVDPGILKTNCKLPAGPGVYAFAKNEVVQYVGVATKGIAKRLYFYGRPGPKQITNQRLNAIILTELRQGQRLDILVATPSNFEWNGLPVNGVVGLEAGLIDAFFLPWNVRGK